MREGTGATGGARSDWADADWADAERSDAAWAAAGATPGFRGGDRAAWIPDLVRRVVPVALRIAAWGLPVGLGALILYQDWPRRVLGAPYDELWLALVVLGTLTLAAVARVERARLTVAPFLAIEAAAACALTDVLVFAGEPVRDFLIYRHAGAAFLAAAPVYLAAPLHAYPANPGDLPYLYPPPTLPFAAMLAVPPEPIAAAGWVAFSALAVLLALRRFGLSWAWALAAIAWPPVFVGLYVGNVAVPAAALFALGPSLGWSLVLGPVLKPQDAIPALWVLRTGRWRQLAVGVSVLLALVIGTLPLTGLDRWMQWLGALVAYRQSQAIMPGLYGASLSHLLPYGAFLLVAGIAVVLALRYRGRRGLAALGLASTAVSPVLWAHGFIVAAPAFLMLGAPLLWTAVGLTSLLNTGPGWQLVMLLGALPLAVAWTRHRAGEPWHPLGPAAGPWPAADDGGDAEPEEETAAAARS